MCMVVCAYFVLALVQYLNSIAELLSVHVIAVYL